MKNKIFLTILLQLTTYVVCAQVPVVPTDTDTESRYMDNKGTITELSFTNTTIGYVFAAGHMNGAGPNPGTTLYALNCTITRTNTGRYTVAFPGANPHPSGNNYPITFGGRVNSANNARDARDVQVVQGSQSATGFNVIVTTGDNGTGADPYVDDHWYFSVPATIRVITDVELVVD